MTTKTLIERAAGNIGPDLFTTIDCDISGVSSIALIVRYENGQSIEKQAIIDDAVAGEFHIEWVAGDLIDGDHEIEWRFVTGSQVVTLPNNRTDILRVRQRA